MVVKPGVVLVMCHWTKDPMAEFLLVVIATPYGTRDV
jgi:hypothetical protein